MNKTLESLSNATSLPRLSQVFSTNKQNIVIPRKYKKIPKKFYHQPIEFSFSGIDCKKYKFKSNDVTQIYSSSKKVGRSLHENENGETLMKTILSFSSKEGNMERKIQQFQYLPEEEAKQLFYKAYTNKVRTQHKSQQASLMTSILYDLDRYQMLPKQIEALRLSEHQPLKLNQFGLNKGNMLKLISKVTGKVSKCPNINLSKNNLDSSKCIQIIQKLANVKDVNLSSNSIGKAGVISFINLFKNPKCSIVNLNISNNNLSDRVLFSLIKSIDSHPLQCLDISRNHIKRKTSIQLKNLLKQNNLKQLYLGWSQLDSLSACYIFDALTVNTSLQFLDMSWNPIGNLQKMKVSIAKMLLKNKQLIHLDLSYCPLTIEQWNNISEALNQNHSLIGLHTQGNRSYLDCRGYLNITKTDKIQYQKQQINKLKVFNRNIRSPSCWICQSWKKFELQFVRKSIYQQYFIHFSFQNYEKTPIQFFNLHSTFHRVVPSEKFKFFLTHINQKKQQQILTLDSYQKITSKVVYSNKVIKQMNTHESKIEVNFRQNIDIQPRTLNKIKDQRPVRTKHSSH